VNKIPTLFVRDPLSMSRVTQEMTPGCEWVMAGEGIPTRKWDGSNVRVTVYWIARAIAANLEKRRNPTREDKAAGAEPGYVAADRQDPSDKHIFAALDADEWLSWPDGSWSCEAIGPKIQGGLDGTEPRLIPFSLPGYAEANRLAGAPLCPDYSGLAAYLKIVHIEGIVWHHPDGRMAKIKRRDFGLPWVVKK